MLDARCSILDVRYSVSTQNQVENLSIASPNGVRGGNNPSCFAFGLQSSHYDTASSRVIILPAHFTLTLSLSHQGRGNFALSPN
ncbi:MAG: hypothetical protein AB1797_01620 [bacterium]